MHTKTVSPAGLQTALAVRDLSNPLQGPHAVSLVVERVAEALALLWGKPPTVLRPSPVVSVTSNYDDLAYPANAPARSPRYARYLEDGSLLRTHTTAAIPGWLASADRGVDDSAVLIPGMVWRRDCVDKRHVGEPHQLDAWRLVQGKMSRADLLQMIAAVVESVLPGIPWRGNETKHHYTQDGLEVEVFLHGNWVEVLECGLICSELLARKGLDAREWSGLAMGIGLDRMVMVAKGMDDIRLLRSEEPRVAVQMLDLQPWRPVSMHKPASRDLSVAHPAGLDDESLGDLLRSGLTTGQIRLLEEASIVERWMPQDLPAIACQRLGLGQGQENLLVRLVVRSADGPVSKEECAAVYASAYTLLHQGSAVGYL